jgi:hypothetical protein
MTLEMLKCQTLALIHQRVKQDGPLGYVLDLTGGAADPEYIITINANLKLRCYSTHEGDMIRPSEVPLQLLGALIENPKADLDFDIAEEVLADYTISS